MARLFNIVDNVYAPRGANPHTTGLVFDLDFTILVSGRERNLGADPAVNDDALRSAAGLWLNKYSMMFRLRLLRHEQGDLASGVQEPEGRAGIAAGDRAPQLLRVGAGDRGRGPSIQRTGDQRGAQENSLKVAGIRPRYLVGRMPPPVSVLDFSRSAWQAPRPISSPEREGRRGRRNPSNPDALPQIKVTSRAPSSAGLVAVCFSGGAWRRL